MASKLLIRGARQLITLRGSRNARRGAGMSDLGIIPDGSVLVRDGIVAEVGPTRRVENLAESRGAEEVNAAGCVVLPGFVDSHTHLLYPLPGSYEPADCLSMLRAEPQSRLEARARGYLEAMARHGSTTVEVKTGCGCDEATESKLLRALAALRDSPLDIVPTFLLHLQQGDDSSHVTDWAIREWLPKLRKRGWARFADAVWDHSPLCEPDLVRYLELARSRSWPTKLHIEQGDSRAAVAAAVGNFSASVDHLEQATAWEVAMLSRSCTVATLLPCASFQQRGSMAPARALITAGVAVALGTNFNPLHTPALNMQTAIALAARSLGMTAAEAITAATINGAHALGCADRIGSLEPGKQADLLVLAISDYRDLAHRFGGNLVLRTIKRGRTIYSEAEVSSGEVEDHTAL